jgi:CDP-glucose 4,6-dehydratase
VKNNFWHEKNVFITGCTGLLGSWLTQALVDLGANVTGLIRDEVPQSHLLRSGTIDQIQVVRGELCDYPLLERTLAEYEIEIIFHLAAQTIVTIANRAPLSTFESNIRGTYMLLEAARRNPTVHGVITASSDKAYGDQPELPYREDAPLQGQHPYDVSKSCADLISHTYAHSYGLPVIITRCANLYGGGDLNWNRILPGTIRSVLQGERPIIRSDGTFKRDFRLCQGRRARLPDGCGTDRQSRFARRSVQFRHGQPAPGARRGQNDHRRLRLPGTGTDHPRRSGKRDPGSIP